MRSFSRGVAICSPPVLLQSWRRCRSKEIDFSKMPVTEVNDVQKEYNLSDEEMKAFHAFSAAARKVHTDAPATPSTKKVSTEGTGDAEELMRKITAKREEEEKEREAAAEKENEGKDAIGKAKSKRKQRRKRTADAILGDVMHDAMRLRDLGQKPSADFVYKKTQERVYEEEYGHKPPSSRDLSQKVVPFPPDFTMHRLLKFSPGDTAECSTYNGMNTFALTKEDPWPERAITRANPVWSRRMKEEDEIHNKGKGLKEMEKRMYEPREGYNLEGEFLDSMDEFAHWESEFLNFLRTTSLPLRRHLPFLHEWYRYYAHRNIRAEKHYIACRNALLLQTKCSKEFFNQTESRVARFRAILSEAHRSLSSPNYDPLRMKKSDLAPFMRMNDSEFAAWREKDKEARNLIVAGLP